MKIKNGIIIFIFALLFVLLIFVINKEVDSQKYNMCDLENVHKQAALVLGARVWSDGTMSDIFADRVETALTLYQDGKVDKILVSGDHGSDDYDEVNAAKKYLLEQNVAPEDIFLDHAGFDTYDSLYRAREVFKADSLIIVTQDFHLPRALYIAKHLDINACGVSADLHSYIGEDSRNRREVLAKVKAYGNIIFNSKPKFLGEYISLIGDGRESWD